MNLRSSIKNLCGLCGSILFILLFPILLTAQDRKHIPINVEEILKQQAAGAPAKSSIDLNERLRAMSGAARFSQDYLLGPGDIIELTVFGIQELNKKDLTLNSEGKISLPFINDVQLIGLTPRESEVKIGTLYEASVMKNPQVSVSVKEYRSQFVNVLGSVLKPGTYQLTRRTFLLDSLAMAGGLSEKADNRALVHRTSESSATSTSPGVIEIDLVQLLEKGEVSLNIQLFAGDAITIPERPDKYFYVLGDVNKGGAFEIRKNERITLSKAIATAGGLTGTASAGKTKIIRQNSDGATFTEIKANAGDIMKGTAKDIELTQNDLVIVPGSTTKKLGKTLAGGTMGFLNTLLYYGVR
jgi:polysaccharide biosynthesis/export protein